MQKWCDQTQGYVDASTAANNNNTTDNPYFNVVLSQLLNNYHKRDANG